MTKTRIALVIMTLAYALTITTAPASAFKEFIQKPMKAAFEIKGNNTQVFKTKAGTVECTEMKGDGGTVVEKTATIPANFEYAGCKAFGIVGAKVTPIEYKLYANGMAAIQSNVTILAAAGKLVECEVEVPEASGGKNSALGTFTYSNLNPGFTAEANVTGITYKIKRNVGGGCGTAEGESKEGTYSGAFKTTGTESELSYCFYTIVQVGLYTENDCATRAIPYAHGFYEKSKIFTGLALG